MVWGAVIGAVASVASAAWSSHENRKAQENSAEINKEAMQNTGGVSGALNNESPNQSVSFSGSQADDRVSDMITNALGQIAVSVGSSAFERGMNKLFGESPKSPQERGRDARAEIDAMYPELNAWDKAGSASSAGATSNATVDDMFNKEMKLKRMELDSAKDIAKMQMQNNLDLAEIQGVNSVRTANVSANASMRNADLNYLVQNKLVNSTVERNNYLNESEKERVKLLSQQVLTEIQNTGRMEYQKEGTKFGSSQIGQTLAGVPMVANWVVDEVTKAVKKDYDKASGFMNGIIKRYRNYEENYIKDVERLKKQSQGVQSGRN